MLLCRASMFVGVTAAVSIALGACSPTGGASSPALQPNAPQLTTAGPAFAAAGSVTVPLAATISSAALPSAGGLAGTFSLQATNAPPGSSLLVDATTSTSATVRTALRTKSGITIVEDIGFTAPVTVSLAGLPGFTIRLPADIKTAGRVFFLAVADPAATPGALIQDGPATLTGRVLTFAATNVAFTLQAGQRYVFELYSVPATAAALIRHVVIIVQENRTPDNLFNGFPNADTAQTGMAHDGSMVALHAVNLGTATDINHSHENWLTEWNGGAMNGFDLGSPKTAGPDYPYAYVPRSQVEPYWDLALAYTFGDRMFQSNSGPSFPAHQYLIAGGSQLADNNPTKSPWGCDSPLGTTVTLLGPNGTSVPGPFPCFDYTTLGDEMDNRNVTWRYYAPAIGSSGSIWSAYDAIRHIRYGADWTSDVISPETQVLQDVPNGVLADVTWIAPKTPNSDHAGSTSTTGGPDWVASVVNAVGESPFWNSTAIFILWDDWGGWYDHVAPVQLDTMGLGFRVPLIVVSPYAKHGYVSHVRHEHAGVLKFVEEIFGLPSLNEADARADDFADCFDFTRPPQAFTPVATQTTPEQFLRQQNSLVPPDDD